jgi:hypothetical protein
MFLNSSSQILEFHAVAMNILLAIERESLYNLRKTHNLTWIKELIHYHNVYHIYISQITICSLSNKP